MARADLDKQPGDVAAMFDAIAGRYDLLNDLLSAGQVRLWRRAVARIAGAGPGEQV
ncbi:MAG: class I SAM-dependent methyltransferase, partial [Streptosporangiales bacterium]